MNNFSSSTRDITYLYDESGIVGAIQKLGSTEETFYFDKNIKGDVIALYNSAGTKVANYIYDAWGNCTTKTIVVNNFSAYNPIRYRGYYYDRETKLYYLNARYYNPEWRRFISPDDTAYLGPDTPSGLNLYAYCNNDPVNYSDGSGHSLDSVWKTLLGVVVGVGLAVVTVAAVVASGGALLVPVLVGAGVGIGLNLVGQGVSNLTEGKGFFDDINLGNVALGGLAGAAFATGVGGLWGAVAIGATSNAGMSALEGNSWANIGFSALVGGVSAFAGFKLGKFVSNKLLNINTNLGIGDYVNMARVDGAGFLSRSAVALMSKLYTMGPTIVTGVGRGVTKFVGNYIGDLF